jgi:hypothetical protein
MRRLAPLFLLCLSIDFTNPMLPGSVRFDPGESVEAAQAGPYQELAGRALPASDPNGAPPPAPLQSPATSSVAVIGGLRSHLPMVRHRARESDSRTSASPLEDH